MLGIRAAGTRGGGVQGGLTPCSLLPLECQSLGLSLGVSVNSSAVPLAVVWTPLYPHILTVSVGLLCSGSMEREMRVNRLV